MPSFSSGAADMCNQEEVVRVITGLSAEFISALVLEEKKSLERLMNLIGRAQMV